MKEVSRTDSKKLNSEVSTSTLDSPSSTISLRGSGRRTRIEDRCSSVESDSPLQPFHLHPTSDLSFINFPLCSLSIAPCVLCNRSFMFLSDAPNSRYCSETSKIRYRNTELSLFEILQATTDSQVPTNETLHQFPSLTKLPEVKEIELT